MPAHSSAGSHAGTVVVVVVVVLGATKSRAATRMGCVVEVVLVVADVVTTGLDARGGPTAEVILTRSVEHSSLGCHPPPACRVLTAPVSPIKLFEWP